MFSSVIIFSTVNDFTKRLTLFFRVRSKLLRITVGGVAQWLGRRSLAGGLSLICV